MRCSVEYADGVSDQFNFFLVSWDVPGEVMCFREKSREVEGITLDGVKDFKIKLAVEQAILLACCPVVAQFAERSYTGQGRARHPVFDLIVLLAFFTYVVFAKSRWR